MKEFDTQKIKELRIRRNMSQCELAQLVGVSDQAISKWELGYAQPSALHLIKLTQIFDVDAETFLHAPYAEKRDMNTTPPMGMKSLTELYKIG